MPTNTFSTNILFLTIAYVYNYMGLLELFWDLYLDRKEKSCIPMALSTYIMLLLFWTSLNYIVMYFQFYNTNKTLLNYLEAYANIVYL